MMKLNYELNESQTIMNYLLSFKSCCISNSEIRKNVEKSYLVLPFHPYLNGLICFVFLLRRC